MKRFLSTLLIIAVIIAFIPSKAISAGATSDAEIAKHLDSLKLSDIKRKYVLDALALGIAWDGLFQVKKVTSKDMTRLLKNANDKAYGQGQYKVLSFYLAKASQAPVTRMETAQMIYDAHLERGFSLKPKSFNDFCAQRDKAFQRGNGYWITNVSLSNKLIQMDDGSVVSYDPFNNNAPDAVEIKAAGKVEAVKFVIDDYDRISDDKIMELFEDNTFRLKATIAPAEAVLIAYHYYRSLEPIPEYVPVTEVSTYNAKIITPDIVKKGLALPAASSTKLPEWKGYNKQFMATMMGVGDEGSMWVTEEEIRSLADTGANFLRLWMSFGWFEGPAYANKDLVNKYYIEHLDSIIAWCMKYGMHLQVSLVNMPGMDRNTHPDDEKSLVGRIYTDEVYRNRCLEWYRMIARRYAALPNNCFSINLINEPEVSDDATYTKAFRPIVEAIWNESPGRVIVSDTGGNVSGEGMAKIGVALSSHTYEPSAFGVVVDERKSYQSMKWPYQYVKAPLYGPEMLGWNDVTQNTINTGSTFNGYVAGTWSIFLNYIDKNNAKLAVVADGKILYEGTPPSEPINGGTGGYATEPVKVDIPKGSKTVQLKCTRNSINLGYVQIKQEDGTQIYIGAEVNEERINVPAVITINRDGSFSGGEVIDAKKVVERDILPTKALADRYGVGFMVGEMGMYGVLFAKNIIPRKEVKKLYEDMASTLDGYGIPWVVGALQGWYSLVMPVPFYEQYQYKKIEGSANWVDIEMAEFFGKLFAR